MQPKLNVNNHIIERQKFHEIPRVDKGLIKLATKTAKNIC